MNKKYIDFIRRILKVDDFLVVQFVFLIPLLFFGFNYTYYSFKNPSKNSYNARFESYSGVLHMVYANKGRGKSGGGIGMGRIVIEGDKGRVEFKLNRYSTYNKVEVIASTLGKSKFFNPL